jgi:glycosyltransferase involved in cell wall biosynthesis
VQHEQTGILINAGDADTLAKKIVALKNDVQMRRQLGDKAFSFVQNYSAQNMATAYHSLYNGILNQA